MLVFREKILYLFSIDLDIGRDVGVALGVKEFYGDRLR